jgi:HD-GYP domain-containing protein (c-di-GMP phosphodiesterase class II)
MQATGDFSREGFISYFGVPLIAKGQVKGVMEIYQRDILDLEPEATTFLEMLASQAAIAIDNTELFYNLQSSNAELVLAYDGTLAGWASAQELRDKEIEGHTRRAADLTTRLARAVGMSEGELMHIHRGALLHDIGKMGIPESVVLKPGPLTEDEWAIMRKHPEHGFKMLAPISYLQPALEIPYSHHERWDGSGYPRGLKGDQIPLAARVFAVVDVWDALTSDRPYRPAWTEEETRAYLRQQAGILFEPRIVEIFLGEIINAERR